jgi:hypothetical protein
MRVIVTCAKKNVIDARNVLIRAFEDKTISLISEFLPDDAYDCSRRHFQVIIDKPYLFGNPVVFENVQYSDGKVHVHKCTDSSCDLIFHSNKQYRSMRRHTSHGRPSNSWNDGDTKFFQFRSPMISKKYDSARDWSAPLQQEKCQVPRCEEITCIGIGKCAKHLARENSLEIKKSTVTDGLGLFACSNSKRKKVFERSQVIALYDGEPITEEEVRKRYGRQVGPYVLKDNVLGYFDGALRRGIGTMCNACDNKPKHKECNCNAIFVHLTSYNTVAIETIKTVRNGEEILCRYKPQTDPNIVFSTENVIAVDFSSQS